MVDRDGRGITQVLVDFGQVITFPQPASTPDELAALGGAGRDGMVERYWAYRPGYDAGLSDLWYWSTVVGRPLAGEPDLVEALVAADTASWMRLDMRVVDAVVAFAGAGRGLAILSNAPHRIADEVDAAAWATPFDHRIFSCRLGVVKPDPAIFAAALDVTGATAATTLFVDDRTDNIEAAAALGLRVHHFTGVDGLLGELARS